MGRPNSKSVPYRHPTIGIEINDWTPGVLPTGRVAFPGLTGVESRIGDLASSEDRNPPPCVPNKERLASLNESAVYDEEIGI